MMSRPTLPEPKFLMELRHGEATTEQQQEAYRLLGWVAVKFDALQAENAELRRELKQRYQENSAQRKRHGELLAENAELRKETESCADVNADLLDGLTRAVELLWDAWGNIDSNYEELLSEIHAFLTEMEGPHE
jgi:cell division protein FtsB